MYRELKSIKAQLPDGTSVDADVHYETGEIDDPEADPDFHYWYAVVGASKDSPAGSGTRIDLETPVGSPYASTWKTAAAEVRRWARNLSPAELARHVGKRSPRRRSSGAKPSDNARLNAALRNLK